MYVCLVLGCLYYLCVYYVCKYVLGVICICIVCYVYSVCMSVMGSSFNVPLIDPGKGELWGSFIYS